MILIILLMSALINSSGNPMYWSNEAVKLSRPILWAINNERRDSDLYTVSYDYQFNQFLTDLKSTEWFDKRSNKTAKYPLFGNVNNTVNFNAYFLMQEPELKFWGIYGYEYCFSFNKQRKLRYLLAQEKSCYNPWQCSRTEFTNYVSCIINVRSCFGKNKIYPKIYDIDLSRISCVSSTKNIHCYCRNLPNETDFPYDSESV